MLITDLAATVTYMGLCEEVRVMCSLAQQQPITLKWIDDEGMLVSHRWVGKNSVVARVDKMLR